MKFKKKGKKILSTILILASILLIVGVITTLTRRNKADDGFDLVKLNFERGTLDATGEYSETKGSIYTKDVFVCGTSVRVKIDFDSDVTYRIFFYDEDDEFIEASDEYDKTETVLAPEGAEYARILVIPEWDDIDVDKQIIRSWKVRKYAKQLTVMVTPD